MSRNRNDFEDVEREEGSRPVPSDPNSFTTGRPGNTGFVEFEPVPESDRVPPREHSKKLPILKYPPAKYDDYIIIRRPLGRQELNQHDPGRGESRPSDDE